MVDGSGPGKATRAALSYLVRSPNPLGDACMSLPAVRAIRNLSPQGRITVVCRENLVPMWEAQACVDEVIGFPKAFSPLQVGRLLRQHGSFDWGVLLPNSFRSALELRCGGVKKLVGYHRHLRGCLLRRGVKEPKATETPEHHVHRYLALATALGADISRIDELLQIPQVPRPMAPGMTSLHVGLCPGAEYGNAKRYPVERYAAAIETFRARHPEMEVTVSIFGSPNEQGIGEELLQQISPPAVNRAGETTIGGLVDELRQCHLVATNDTGTMHLAAALGVPTVAIFGSTEPLLTAPVGQGHRVIRHQVHCSPCFLRECPVDYRCMLSIEPDEVVREMEALLPT